MYMLRTKICMMELFVCCLPFPCRSRDAGILQYRVYNLGHRNLYNILVPVIHVQIQAHKNQNCRSLPHHPLVNHLN